MRWTFFGCCASAMTATASSITTNRIAERLQLSSLHTPFIGDIPYAEGNREKCHLRQKAKSIRSVEKPDF